MEEWEANESEAGIKMCIALEKPTKWQFLILHPLRTEVDNESRGFSSPKEWQIESSQCTHSQSSSPALLRDCWN